MLTYSLRKDIPLESEREEGERTICETSKFHTPAHGLFETGPFKEKPDTVAVAKN